MADIANLGKVFCKVILYDKLPNLVVNPMKLRMSKGFIMNFQMETNLQRTGFGVEVLTTRDPQNPQAAAIPKPCYEPVDNFVDGTAATSSYGTPIYWKNLGWENISFIFKKAFCTDPYTKPDRKPAYLENSSLPVSLIQYKEQEYADSMIGYRVAPTTSSTVSSSTANVVSAENRNFVLQTENSPGTWWGITPNMNGSENFRVSGGPFWVTIKPNGSYPPNVQDTSKASWLGVKITHDDNKNKYKENVSAGSSGGSSVTNSGPERDNCPDFVFLVNNVGGVYLSYQRNGKIIPMPVNLPHLSENFKNGNMFSVGFMVVCGRLCIYCDEFRYDIIDIYEAPDKFYVGFDLSNPGTTPENEGYRSAEVYGYGCSAYVNVTEMTFYKKCWFILQNLDGKIQYRGEVGPPTAGGGYTVGQFAPGLLINWQIPQEQFASNGSKPMYAAQFQEYYELDLVAGAPPLTPPTSAIGSDSFYTTVNGAKRWNGRIDIVRQGPTVGVTSVDSTDNFWFCYMETFIDAARPTEEKFVYFPILYNVFAKNAIDSNARTGYEFSDFYTTDVSQDVMSVEISSELNDPKPSCINRKATVTLYEDPNDSTDYSQYLYKTRGIKIWLRWSTTNTTIDPTTETPIFTGVAYGEKASLQPGKTIITLTCYDYWKILEGMQIKNSPFYDGFEIVSVIRDLAERAGVFVQDDVDHTNVGWFALGSGFSFDKPSYKFEGTQKIKDCMMKAIQSFPYYMWFDSNGMLHVSIVPGDFDWGRLTPGWDYNVKKGYYRSFDHVPYTRPEKLILNEIELTSNLNEGVYNSFRLDGVQRTTNQAVGITRSNPRSLLDPTSVGYLGYINEYVLRQPAMTEITAMAYMNRLAKMFASPGYETSITTVGHIPKDSSGNEIRPGQFIAIKQTVIPDTSKFRMTRLSHKYDAEKNEWYTMISAYQIETVGWKPQFGTVPP